MYLLVIISIIITCDFMVSMLYV